MKIPKAHRLDSGTWYIQMRLGGGSQYVTGATEKEAIRKAELIKAQYRNELRDAQAAQENPTLSEAISLYLEDKRAVLSPETARKYRNIQKNHWQELMDRKLSKITDRQWQQAASSMLSRYARKTVAVSAGMTKTVAEYFKKSFPKLSLGTDFSEELEESAKFLEPDEILKFVDAAAETEYCIPLLLALSSLRMAEIDGLAWENVGPDYVKIRQVKIKDEQNKPVTKKGAKTKKSVRTVQILIPALQEAIDRERKPSGKVMTCCQQTLRRACAAVCESAGVSVVTVHGLRHSFASLCASAQVNIPEAVCMEMGGWSNNKVLREIYTHVISADLRTSAQRIADFYRK